MQQPYNHDISGRIALFVVAPTPCSHFPNIDLLEKSFGTFHRKSPLACVTSTPQAIEIKLVT